MYFPDLSFERLSRCGEVAGLPPELGFGMAFDFKRNPLNKLKLPEPVAKLTPAVLFIATFSSGSLFD